MRETVIAVMGKMNNGEIAVYLESESTRQDAVELCALPLDSIQIPLDTYENVEQYGKAVREALSTHPAIKDELIQLFSLTPPERSTLKFLIRTVPGEQLRWESLWNENPPRFLAMSDTCTISRITPARSGPGLRTFSYPLRMVAFLSAAGISAAVELAKICDQVARVRENGMLLECTAYLGEQQLLNDTQKAVIEGNLKGVTVAPIPGTAIEIDNLLRSTPIQFLHFFCHGVERDGIQGLCLATINDHDRNEANGNADSASIFLAVDALATGLALNTDVWITVLNCCSGGQAIRRLHSMALNIARIGCPYTVGMAEPIDSAAATTFSEAFYGELFAIVTKSLTQGAADAPLILDLSPAVIPARKMMYAQFSNAPPFARWLLPLLYERVQQPLVVQSVQPAMAKRIQDVARTLRAMSPDTPSELRDQILKILDKDPAVPVSLRPDRYGGFV